MLNLLACRNYHTFPINLQLFRVIVVRLAATIACDHIHGILWDASGDFFFKKKTLQQMDHLMDRCMDRCMEGILQRNSMSLYSLSLGHLTPKVNMEMERNVIIWKVLRRPRIVLRLDHWSITTSHQTFAGEFCGRQCLAN